MANQKYLNIADFTIKLQSNFEFELEIGYDSFITKEETPEPDVTIQCYPGIPTLDLPKKSLVFEAKNEIQKFYSIYQTGPSFAFIIYNQQTKDEIQQVAILDETFSRWEVYSNYEDDKIIPLKYPLGPIIMHYLTVKSSAVMIHASCIFDGQKGRIFTGFSGAGKSTISKIWADAGNLVINDDRLIIRKLDNDFFVYNTPMYYNDRPKKTPLDAIFLISHFPENKMKKLDGALAVSRVMAFCIQNNFDSNFIQNNLNFISELSTNVSVFELGFVPNESVINFILENETTGTN